MSHPHALRFRDGGLQLDARLLPATDLHRREAQTRPTAAGATRVPAGVVRGHRIHIGGHRAREVAVGQRDPRPQPGEPAARQRQETHVIDGLRRSLRLGQKPLRLAVRPSHLARVGGLTVGDDRRHGTHGVCSDGHAVQLSQRSLQGLLPAEQRARPDEISHRTEPRVRAWLAVGHRGLRRLHTQIQLPVEREGLGLELTDPAGVGGVRRRRQRTPRAQQGALEVVARELTTSGADEPLRGLPRRAPAVIVLGERERIAVADALEPRARHAVTEEAILIGQHRVHRLPHESAAKAKATITAARGDRPLGDDHLPAREEAQVVADHAVAGILPEQLSDPLELEVVAEDAGGSQHATQVRIERRHA